MDDREEGFPVVWNEWPEFEKSGRKFTVEDARRKLLWPELKEVAKEMVVVKSTAQMVD